MFFNMKVALSLLASSFLVGHVSADVMDNSDAGMCAAWSQETPMDFCMGAECAFVPGAGTVPDEGRRMTDKETMDLLKEKKSNLRPESRHLLNVCGHNEGLYVAEAYPQDEDVYAWAIINACTFEIIDGAFGGSGMKPQDKFPGGICVPNGQPIVFVWASFQAAATVVFHAGEADTYLVGSIAASVGILGSAFAGSLAAGFSDADSEAAASIAAAIAAGYVTLPGLNPVQILAEGGGAVANYPVAFSGAGSLSAIGYSFGLGAGAATLVAGGTNGNVAGVFAASMAGGLSLIKAGAILTMIGRLNCHPAEVGDPHFKTWSGHWYDFHGQCDLVTVSSHKLEDSGLDMSMHTRTKKRMQFSYVEAVALNIGEDILEVSAFGQYFVNGVEGAELPYLMGGKYAVNHTAVNKKRHSYDITLSEGETISITSHKDLVSIQLGDVTKAHFGDSLGLMGQFGTGKMIARDGVTVITDPNEFGQEWQVRADEDGRLFESPPSVEYPEKCTMPDPKEFSRRLGEGMIEESAAEEACAHFSGVAFDNCVFDVMAVGDLDAAHAGAF